MAKFSLAVIVYSLWRERNDCIFSNGGASKLVLIKRIRRLVENKASKLTKIAYTHEKQQIAMNWGLLRTLFKSTK